MRVLEWWAGGEIVVLVCHMYVCLVAVTEH